MSESVGAVCLRCGRAYPADECPTCFPARAHKDAVSHHNHPSPASTGQMVICGACHDKECRVWGRLALQRAESAESRLSEAERERDEALAAARAFAGPTVQGYLDLRARAAAAESRLSEVERALREIIERLDTWWYEADPEGDVKKGDPHPWVTPEVRALAPSAQHPNEKE